MEKKVGVYICRGCDIGEGLDIDALSSAANEANGDLCKDHPCFCGDAGLAVIKDDLQDGVNAIVVAGCSQRFNADTFAFDGVFTDRVNLREHVVWSHEPNDEDTQMMGEDYLRMGITRAQKAEIPTPFELEIDKTIMVVGGGPTGMAAATAAARAGYQVVIVEKEAELGGWRRKITREFPTKAPYRDLQSVDVEGDVRALEADSRVTIHTSAVVDSIKGQPGQLDVTLTADGEKKVFRVGAIVQATGWKPYDANRLGHLGYGECANVITNVQMEEMLATDKVVRPSDGQPARSVLFIQCAGSRDEAHLPYCSAVCCRVSLKQAMQVRELDGDSRAYVVYKDIRTPGQYEDFYRRAQEDRHIFFTKGEISEVRESDGQRVVVKATDTLLGEEIEIEVDLVVLATGMVPVAADSEAVRSLVDAKAIVAKNEAGAQLEAAKKAVQANLEHEGTAILNLDYRQGPDLPVLKYNFPDSHFICFPFESRRTGIYAAGCVRAPNDVEVSQDDGAGAALKAIECVELASQGKAVHPRWNDMSHPDFFLQRCTQCKRCTEECPFGAIDEDAKGTPLPNPGRCRRCGICLGACPERIVSFKDYSIDIVSSMIKSVEIPDEFEEKPRLLGFICENDAAPALDTAGMKRLQHSAYIRFIPVRCLGSINVVWIADALSQGFDGILLVGCKSGEDYQCHYIRGSELMGTRGGNIKEKLKQLALEEERVRIEELSIADFERLPAIINEFAEEIEEIGLNPFKGF